MEEGDSYEAENKGDRRRHKKGVYINIIGF
jgi:hypothetical protein